MEGQIALSEYVAIENLSGALDTAAALVGKVPALMAANPLLCVLLACGLLSAAIRIFARLRRASR